jgi:hypothetical protein
MHLEDRAAKPSCQTQQFYNQAMGLKTAVSISIAPSTSDGYATIIRLQGAAPSWWKWYQSPLHAYEEGEQLGFVQTVSTSVSPQDTHFLDRQRVLLSEVEIDLEQVARFNFHLRDA